MKRRNLTIPALLALMLAGSVPPTVAQTGNEDDADGPGRGVARLSLMNGEVSVRRGDSGDWVAGAINAPLMTEDRVFAGPRSRAEVQFDYYHRIRLAADTEVRLADIENGRYLLQLARGTATFSALKGGDAQVEISTPAAAVRPVAYGSYRITVGPDGTAEIRILPGTKKFR
ncbi:MAG TPA: FecR domain-containing protein, partial [Bryobacteraceae bacterium]|nr:FecR domain-containing protein [Bryobacteraceae bacterium]